MDGLPVDIEVQDHRGFTRDGERSTQNEVDASSSTLPSTAEDQNRDLLRDPSPRWRGEDPPSQNDQIDVWDRPPAPVTPMTAADRAKYAYSDKVCRLWDLIDAAIPGILHSNEMNGIEAMMEREDYWEKIVRAICNQRGYEPAYTQLLLDRARRNDAA